MQAREGQPSTTNKGDQDWKRDNHPENETCPNIAQYNHKRRPGLKKHYIMEIERERHGEKNRKDASTRSQAQYNQQRRPGLKAWQPSEKRDMSKNSAVHPQKATRSKDTLDQETRRKTRKDGACTKDYIQQRRPGLKKQRREVIKWTTPIKTASRNKR